MLALEILGALLVGVTLGLLGAGGAMVTVPILAYVVGRPAKLAVAESLLIVGSIALVSALQYARRGLVDWRTAILLAVPGMIGGVLGASIASFLSGRTQMLLFAAVTVAAAIRMLTAKPVPEGVVYTPRPAWQPLSAGLGIGVLTGLVGVGGGFLLVPTLFGLLGVPMRRAVATSLVVIATNSLMSFGKHAWALRDADPGIDFQVAAIFVLFGVAGGFAGTWVSPRIPQATLRTVFAVALVLAAVTIVVAEVFPRGTT
ncbi:MAG: sulfite exporter TauE/SafE family protein [Phycisphaerae bacterium]|nr:sulfite exporter TauE/SafE family protein [Phycisphaerae bacterium]